jgi:ribosomal protein S27E
MSQVLFFADEIICNNCERETHCIVEEFSGIIACDNCGYVLADFSDDEENVVIFTLESETVQ